MTDKEYYQWLKQKGICPACKKSKAAKGKVRCSVCSYNDNAYKKAKYEMKKVAKLNG